MNTTEVPMTARRTAGIAGRTQTLTERARETAMRPLERVNGVQVNPFMDSLPTPERLAKHSGFVVEKAYDETLAKAATAKPVMHARTLDTLGRLLRARVLDERQAMAGWTFAEQFAVAALDGLRVTNLLRTGGGGHVDMAPKMMHARDWIAEAMRDMGKNPTSNRSSLVADTVYWICGVGLTLKELSARRIGPASIAVGPRTAVGLLVGGLTILAQRNHD